MKGYTANEPFTRTLKCLISPKMQNVKHLGVGMVIIPPGNKSLPHKHDVSEETWYVVSGRGQITIDDETENIEPEMLIVAPPKTLHFITNNGTEPLKMLWFFTPPGPEEEHIK